MHDASTSRTADSIDRGQRATSARVRDQQVAAGDGAACGVGRGRSRRGHDRLQRAVRQAGLFRHAVSRRPQHGAERQRQICHQLAAAADDGLRPAAAREVGDGRFCSGGAGWRAGQRRL